MVGFLARQTHRSDASPTSEECEQRSCRARLMGVQPAQLCWLEYEAESLVERICAQDRSWTSSPDGVKRMGDASRNSHGSADEKQLLLVSGHGSAVSIRE